MGFFGGKALKTEIPPKRPGLGGFVLETIEAEKQWLHCGTKGIKAGMKQNGDEIPLPPV